MTREVIGGQAIEVDGAEMTTPGARTKVNRIPHIPFAMTRFASRVRL